MTPIKSRVAAALLMPLAVMAAETKCDAPPEATVTDLRVGQVKASRIFWIYVRTPDGSSQRFRVRKATWKACHVGDRWAAGRCSR